MNNVIRIRLKNCLRQLSWHYTLYSLFNLTKIGFNSNDGKLSKSYSNKKKKISLSCGWALKIALFSLKKKKKQKNGSLVIIFDVGDFPVFIRICKITYKKTLCLYCVGSFLGSFWKPTSLLMFLPNLIC